MDESQSVNQRRRGESGGGLYFESDDSDISEEEEDAKDYCKGKLIDFLLPE